MADLLALLAAAALGAGLGAVFFMGLWWTVHRLPVSRHPGTLALGSFVVRAAVVAVGLALLAGDPSLLVSALVGFLVARWAALRRGRTLLVARGA
jgi:F1F0 ATPase subunit 2